MKNFNDVYRENYEIVFNFLNRKIYSGDSELAKDLANDTMMKVYNNLHKFDGDKASLQTWIITIAKNVLIDHSRKVRIDTESMNSFVDKEGRPTLHIESDTTPLSTVVNQQLGEGIQMAFNKLPEAYRKYADLFFNQQLSYDEIAVEMNKPLGTVKGSIHRTRELLHGILKNFQS